jgi:hypothetical protein
MPRLEQAILRAKTAAWPWQLEQSVTSAEKVLERWRALVVIEAAMVVRCMLKRVVNCAETCGDTCGDTCGANLC